MDVFDVFRVAQKEEEALELLSMVSRVPDPRPLEDPLPPPLPSPWSQQLNNFRRLRIRGRQADLNWGTEAYMILDVN